MALTSAEFARRYRTAALSERASAQSHFLDLCDMLGEPHPAAADAIGDRYTFEKHVARTSGGKGFADVWLRDHFAWEYKGKHKDLRAAYLQLLDYREDLLNPPLLVVCDLDRFEIHTNFGKTKKRVYAFDLRDLERNQPTATCPFPPLEVLRALFQETDKLRPERTDAFVTQEAARTFARMAERLEIEKRAHTDSPIHTREQIAHFLIRLLFCLFADNIGLLPRHVFRNLIDSDDRFSPRTFLRKLKVLFAAMSQPDGIFGEHTIKYFNGGLFDSDSIIELDHADLAILHTVATRFDWSHVAPAIFGTLFERSLDPARRSLIGAHYTSEDDILLLIEPVVIAPLRQRWEQTRDSVLACLSSFAPGKGSALQPEAAGPSPAARTKTSTGAATPDANPKSPHSTASALTPIPGSRGASKRTPKAPSLLASHPEAEALLAAWFDTLAQVRILDPACGSGNFLYVALRRLLDLWLEAREFAIEHNIQLAMQYAADRMVSPTQLFGIEIEFYAHELASVVVWIGFLQWKHDHNIRDDKEPILLKLNNIEHADAILRYDEQGNPYEPEWPQADFIVSNPPFLGDKKMRRELDTPKYPKYTDDARRIYQGRVPGGADLVTFWFEKARQQVASRRTKRVGLLATNSISMVGNRSVLQRIKESGSIFFAWSDRPWLLAGAAVRVAMIGFDNGEQITPMLDGEEVQHIHSDLTAGTEVTSAAILNENRDICFLGVMKGGSFDLSSADARKLLSLPLNPNGKSNADVIRRRMGGQDVSGRDRQGWIIDFSAKSEIEAALYEAPFELIKRLVKPKRDENRDVQMNGKWWLHGRSRPALRSAISSLRRCVITPEVNKYRLFAWMPTTVIPDHKLHVFAREDDYFFGVLHSLAHETWTLATCSWIGKGNDPCYNSATTFETFPFPYPPGQEPTEADSLIVRAIADAARNLVHLRDAWLNPPGASQDDLKQRTLTKLYNLRAAGKCAWLENAHTELDRAVFAAYGWPYPLTKDEILSRLLALNHERAANQPQTAPKPAPKFRRQPKSKSAEPANPPT